MSKILVFDNYDSFTYNLVHIIEKLLHQKVDVCKNDEYEIEMFEHYDKIVLSPGPGIPSEAGLLKKLIEVYAPTKKHFRHLFGSSSDWRSIWGLTQKHK